MNIFLIKNESEKDLISRKFNVEYNNTTLYHSHMYISEFKFRAARYAMTLLENKEFFLTDCVI